jgi:hypothetical protein
VGRAAGDRHADGFDAAILDPATIYVRRPGLSLPRVLVAAMVHLGRHVVQRPDQASGRHFSNTWDNVAGVHLSLRYSARGPVSGSVFPP